MFAASARSRPLPPRSPGSQAKSPWLCLALAALLSSASPARGQSGAGEKASRILSLRNLGVAQLEEGKDKEARATFARLAEVVPDEPLPWADGAIAALRGGDLAGADQLLARARQAGGERGDLWGIAAAIENARGRPEAVRAALAKGASLDPRDLEARWRWVRSAESDPNPAPAVKEARRKYLGEIVAASPANLPARLRLFLVDLEAGDAAAAKKDAAELERLLADADPKSRQFLADASALAEKGELKGASLKARILENLLRVTPRYLQSLGELQTNVVGLPLVSFSPKLEASLRPRGASSVPVSFHEGGTVEAPDVTLRRVDLLASGRRDVYPVPAPFKAVSFFDYDLDGDLDVYLSGGTRPDRLLRNNLDGTFTDVTSTMAAAGEPEFVSKRTWVSDLDRDGDLDLLAVDGKGNLVIRENLRQGRFRTVPLGLSGVEDAAVEDVNADGAPDIVAATSSGLVLLVNRGDGHFNREAGGELSAATAGIPFTSVFLADLDNDGLVDIAATGPKGLVLLRATGPGTFAPWTGALKGPVAAERVIAWDVDQDGDLDLVLERGGKPLLLVNEGGNANAWLGVTLEGLQAGSGKVNRDGLGSTVELKSGDLYAIRTVSVLPTQLGLGARSKADVVRVLWTNGVPQNFFDQKARTVAKEIQQLKGSCPFVYAFNGETGEWHFVSDALGRAPIGLLYDGVHLAGADTTEWLFVDRDQLRPTPEGWLLVDYTEELWEVAYLDEATLAAVDHPEGTEVVPNERMVPHPLSRKLFGVTDPRPVRSARSTVEGTTTDVTERLAKKDGLYVDPGPETRYQGIRAPHDLVLDLGPLSEGDRVVLFLDGWIFYTDTSINVAVSQRADVSPFPPLLEVPDGRGGWRVAIASLGFPAGKTKRMPVDLTGIVDPSDPRVRIRTTSAIFWDQAFVTVNAPEVPVVRTDLPPVKATLSWRGFSRRYRETPDGPELFDHSAVSPFPAWEDVPGFLTRYGDVTPLLRKADDRWVAFRGGDAIRITYDARLLPPLPAGWRRDWLLVSDGWDKDFDKNTVTGQSVEPWPFHGMSSYPYPPGERHPDSEFLREWLTRRVGPEEFRGAILEGRVPATR